MDVQTKAVELPAMPDGRMPVVGHLVAVAKNPLGALDRWHAEKGDLYRVALPTGETWVINRPELIERVLTAHNAFIKDKDLRDNKVLFGEGLLTSEGDFWLRQRRLAQPAFHREHLAGYAAQMVELTSTFIESWRAGEVRDLHGEMMALTLRVVSQTLFGDDGVPAREVSENLDVVMQRFEGFYSLWPQWLRVGFGARYATAVERLDTVVYGLITRRRANAQPRRDLLSMFLAATDDDGKGMSDRQLRDELMTMLLAGHETTANALAWTFHLLAQAPEVERQLYDEVKALSGPPTLQDLPKLSYAGAVIKEALRLYPPAWIVGREAVTEFELNGHRLRKGTQVAMSQWVVHRDPRFYPEPLAFRPQRWLDGSTTGLHAYAYFPFGGGQRLCIGKAFAQMEAVLLLATLLRRFRFVPHGPAPRPRASITLRPSGALQMKLEAR